MTWPLAPRSTFSTGKPGRYDVAPVDPSKRRRGRSRECAQRDQRHPGVFLPRQCSHQGKSQLIVCLPGVTSRLRGVVAILL